MRYSKTERILAILLSQFPRLKRVLKYVYQRFSLLIYKKNYSHRINTDLYCIANDHKHESFFGYYDNSPINKDDLILYHSSEHSTSKKPNDKLNIHIMVYDLNSGTSKFIASTSAYNWQQGSKLQWLNDKELIFNDYCHNDKKYVSYLVNVSTLEKQRIEWPIYDVHEDYALTLNFNRLRDLSRDYGYFSSNDAVNYDILADGIFKFNLDGSSYELLTSMSSIIDTHFKQSMLDADHYVNHISISPDGNKFMFLHRWLKNRVRFDALFVVNSDGTNLRCLADDDMVSHCFWKDNNEIIGYLRDKKNGDGYFLIDVKSGKKDLIKRMQGFGDGHPHIVDEVLISDTYPNKSKMKELLFYNLESNDFKILGEFYEPFSFYGETRCDLHPRLSPDKKYLFFDSVHTGKRHLYMIKNE